MQSGCYFSFFLCCFFFFPLLLHPWFTIVRRDVLQHRRARQVERFFKVKSSSSLLHLATSGFRDPLNHAKKKKKKTQAFKMHGYVSCGCRQKPSLLHRNMQVLLFPSFCDCRLSRTLLLSCFLLFNHHAGYDGNTWQAESVTKPQPFCASLPPSATCVCV
jgi:hypothetical protein